MLTKEIAFCVKLQYIEQRGDASRWIITTSMFKSVVVLGMIAGVVVVVLMVTVEVHGNSKMRIFLCY